jgi:NADH dehydrogenase
VVLGGGFGGLAAAQGLAHAPVQVTLVDRRNFHLFQPLLYQVATGALSPADIAAPLRALLARQRNARVLLAEAVDLDVEMRRVILSDGDIGYDSLIVACGSDYHYFGHAEWAPLAPGLKTIEDATRIRRRILIAFEAAEREPDLTRRAEWLTFVIVGGGPTGVELAGALAEIARHTLRRDFRRIDPAAARVLLVEGAERILPSYPLELSVRAEHTLARLRVEARTSTRVIAIADAAVTLERNGTTESVPARTVLWAAGVTGSSFARVLARRSGAELDRAGRVLVGSDLALPGHPEIFVIGDLAAFSHDTGKPLPGVAPVAMQQGRHVAALVARRARGEDGLGGEGSHAESGGADPRRSFRYRDRGTMAVIGRGAAIADFGWLRLSGAVAWLAWLFVHLMALVDFENRILVFIQWAWSYVTWNRGARLITGENPLPLPRSAEDRTPPSPAGSAPAPPREKEPL